MDCCSSKKNLSGEEKGENQYYIQKSPTLLNLVQSYDLLDLDLFLQEFQSQHRMVDSQLCPA
jgi:hypothetical protein